MCVCTYIVCVYIHTHVDIYTHVDTHEPAVAAGHMSPQPTAALVRAPRDPCLKEKVQGGSVSDCLGLDDFSVCLGPTKARTCRSWRWRRKLGRPWREVAVGMWAAGLL